MGSKILTVNHVDRISSPGRHKPATTYRIYPVIRHGFSLSRMASNKSVLRNFAIESYTRFTLPYNPKDLDLSYKMDLDFWDCFEGKTSVL